MSRSGQVQKGRTLISYLVEGNDMSTSHFSEFIWDRKQVVVNPALTVHAKPRGMRFLMSFVSQGGHLLFFEEMQPAATYLPMREEVPLSI